MDWIHIPCNILILVLLIISSLVVKHIRNKHAKAITKRRLCFGLEEERLNMLQKLSTSIKDLMKFNFITAALLISFELCKLIFTHNLFGSTPGHLPSIQLLKLLYLALNPIMYVISMSGLKKAYKTLICQFIKTFYRHTRIHVIWPLFLKF